ncbi:MAG: hypothetical protein ACR2GY_10135 [Phycisphaerales bacterium]
MTHAAAADDALVQFHFEPQPEAGALIDELIASFLDKSEGASGVAERMKRETATRFKDWVDHIVTPRTEQLMQRLAATGFSRTPTPGSPDCYTHHGAMFPRILIGTGSITRIFIKVDSVADFLAAWHIADDPTISEDDIEGEPLSQMRRAPAFRSSAAELWVIERHGWPGFASPHQDADRALKSLKHLEQFRLRKRDWDDDISGIDHTGHLIDAAVAELGADYACSLFFRAEREYWQSRNRAAQTQKARQDRLGLGWANHDHHTYRSSRVYFTRLIAKLEKLGFTCRERFYAGAEAGWGAQVLEQPRAGIVIFADVDLRPEEIRGDFAHEPLPDATELGTVGLWCALHGEAILQAGMHHLECMFDFEALREQLRGASIQTMDPFTDMPHLRQAFTEGERWPVSERRLDRLVHEGRITSQQAAWFRTQGGAVGSHLENLERNDGYKGFNQKGVSEIIAKTDPRKQAFLAGA